MYVDKKALWPHAASTSLIGREIAQAFVRDNVEVVIGPAMGAITLSHEVAEHLTRLTGREVLTVYAEKDGDGFKLSKHHAAIVKDRRVLVVEDVLTTGGSALKTVVLTRDTGGEVVGLGVLCNRGGVEAHDVGDVPKLHALVDITLESWPPDECRLCADGVPINTDVGRGKQFLAQQEEES